VDVPLNIMGPSGSYVRTDNTTGMAYSGSGSGSTAPEQYTAYHAGNTSDRSPVVPGQTALLQSEQTGMWCRLAPLPSNSTQIGMVCDQPTAATAVAFTYTGDGLAVDGVKLVAPGPGQPLLLANTTSAPVNGSTGDELTLSPATPPSGEGLASMMHPTRQAHCSGAATQWAAKASQHAAPDTSSRSNNNSPLAPNPAASAAFAATHKHRKHHKLHHKHQQASAALATSNWWWQKQRMPGRLDTLASQAAAPAALPAPAHAHLP
jgi:hypothetical protein